MKCIQRKSTPLLLFAMLSIPVLLHSQGFLKVSGKYIVNEQNQQIILRGMGLGGWLLPEGYMIKTEDFANAFWQMKNTIIGFVGPANAETFWKTYRTNFVQRKDIDRLKELGFNSVRMVLHWEHMMAGNGSWKEEGFAFIDSVVNWCAANSMYVILDLHAAPGGQSANGISDYNPSFLSLWESDANKQATIALWKKIAERYKDDSTIAGYDLINEPAWRFDSNNAPLRELYINITNAIRSVDTKHILFIEGNWYATDFNGLTPPWDDNMVYSFHKYWNTNDVGSINYLLQLRNSVNRPLWLGESGENSNTWFTDCIALMEANKIGWAWWTLKKFDNIAGPFSVPLTPEYSSLISYWKGQGAQPSVESAMKGLMDMADGLKLENCDYHSDVVDAMIRQPFDVTTRPFRQHDVPGRIFATEYDLGRYGSAYKDNNYQNTGAGTSWNNGYSFRNDGVDIQPCNDVVTNGYNIGWTESGEFLKYTVTVKDNGKYRFSVRFACNGAGATIGLSVDDDPQSLLPLPLTGGWQNWSTADMAERDITAGTHFIKLYMYAGGFNVNYVESKYVGPMEVSSDPSIPTAYHLYQNYPNPFNPSTEIRYDLPAENDVSLTVFTILGEKVDQLVKTRQKEGSYRIQFNASHLSSGLYYYVLQTEQYQETKKMLFIR